MRTTTNGAPQNDRLFAMFLACLFALLALYGLGMTAVLLWGSGQLGARMVTGFIGMFGGVLGLGTGYFVGSRHGGAD